MFLEFIIGSFLGYAWEEVYAIMRKDRAIPPIRGMPFKPVYGVLIVTLLKFLRSPVVSSYPSIVLIGLLTIEHIAGCFTQVDRRWNYKERSISQFTGLDSLCGFELATLLAIIILKCLQRDELTRGC